MSNQSKVCENLSQKKIPKRKKINFIWYSPFYIFEYTKNTCGNELKRNSFTLFEKIRFFFCKWFVDCVNKEIVSGLFFSLILVFFSVGIIFYFRLSREPSYEQFIILIGIFIGLSYVLRFYWRIWLITGFLFCIILGALVAKIETWRMSTPMLSGEIITTLTGRIASIDSMPRGKGYRLNVDVLSTKNPVLNHEPKRVRLIARFLPPKLVVGDGLLGKVKIRALSGSVYPGGYDFSFHSYFKGIGAQGIYLGNPIKISVPQSNTILDTILQKIENLRMKMTKRIEMAIGGEKGSVASALITGQRGSITNDTNEALRVAGLSHILSISGLHMALLSSMILFSIRGILAFFPFFSSYYSAKKIAAIAALMTTFFYLILSGAAVSARRSFVMIAVMLIAVLCNRSALTMRNFAIAGLITLTVSPHEILGPSFQMSFSATAALIAFFDWWKRILSFRRQKTTPSYVCGKVIQFIFLSVSSTCISSFVAGAASGIYAAYHFSNIALLGTISNALALPIISLLIVPFGLTAAFVMLVDLEWFPLQIMGFGIDLVIKISHAVKAISPILNFGFIPPSALILFSIGLVGLTFFKTPIRFFFSFFIFISFCICMMYSSVQLIIANDMNFVGVVNKKKLYTDRYRIPKFTKSILEKSFRVDETIKPTKYGPSLREQFICDNHACTSTLENGLKVVVLYKEMDQCVEADIMIKAFITSNQTCQKNPKITFTLQQLLSRGSVMMTKSGDIIWSSAGFYRPWNMHKRYSRKLHSLLRSSYNLNA
ncbi:ComEC/Rec2 family competence protein [Bartonella sp. B41]